ncbi:MAG TPA: nuclear transport factor 2 family protein [Nocardioidaceae bacterium]|nr:nuclear transport factor 2 family protein [Nocardioidaceae bacterium]
MNSSTDQRIARLEARFEVGDLMAEYLYLVDREPRRESMEALFTEDAIWEPKGNHSELEPVHGRSAIGEMLSGLPESFSFTVHYVTNPKIRISDDLQTADGRWHALEFISTREPVNDLVEVAWYESSFEFHDGRWLISHVKYTDTLVFPYAEGWTNTRFVSLFTGDRIPR